MRWATIVSVIVLLSFAVANAKNYGSYLESPGTPAICLVEDDLFMAWARPDRSLKVGYFTLNNSSREVEQETVESLSDQTGSPLAVASNGKRVAVVWSEQVKNKVYFSCYSLKPGKKFSYLDTRKTSGKSTTGVSAQFIDDDLFVGYTDDNSGSVSILTYSLKKKKPKRGVERKLSECQTEKRSNIAISGNILLVYWEDENDAHHLTTYEIEDTAKGYTFVYLKDYPLNIKTDRDVVVASGENEFLVGYVDRNDRYMYAKSYSIKDDKTLSSGSEIKLSEKPKTSLCLGIDNKDRIFAAYLDQDNGINIFRK